MVPQVTTRLSCHAHFARRGISLPNSAALGLTISAVLGVLSFGILLCSGHFADGDLWAKLALGAHVWKYGAVPHTDTFAFTPALPEYVDHEWGAGAIFFGLLKFFGPNSLMWLKICLAFGTMTAALATGRRAGCGWGSLLFLAIPGAGCVVLGYVPVIRSHAFTYFFFALLLLCLEEIVCRRGRRVTSQSRETVDEDRRGGFRGLPHDLAIAQLFWPGLFLVGLIWVWVNVHGGFVAGLGTIAIYTSLAAIQRISPGPTQQKGVLWHWKVTLSRITSVEPRFFVLLVISLAALLVTCLNPYGISFWRYLLPAVLAKRPFIAEWQPLPVFASDSFLPFRILFFLVLVLVVAGWNRVQKKSWSGLVMLTVTSFLTWRSRRHAPFFGVTAIAFAGPYLTATLTRLQELVSAPRPSSQPERAGERRTLNPFPLFCMNPSIFLAALYGLIALYAAAKWLPEASFQVLAPVGHDPVREADILSLAHAKGNLATPFHWGSYAAWRLYPKIKISMDGRYEAAFPESTFLLNARFFSKSGPDWDRLIREYNVDYVMLDLSQAGLRPEDLVRYGYSLIWVSEGCSALMAREPLAEDLRQIVRALPPTTIDPLDPTIPNRWWVARDQ